MSAVKTTAGRWRSKRVDEPSTKDPHRSRQAIGGTSSGCLLEVPGSRDDVSLPCPPSAALSYFWCSRDKLVSKDDGDDGEGQYGIDRQGDDHPAGPCVCEADPVEQRMVRRL
eukprot:TRINITY_DN14759_c0_g2_i1.p3 TRINITY_DN14759_c0_g2~~TRINITY_DN14759_c0_g2_i1.p3  ORF type:complete len:112 (+),score=9.06 TRINITY_DN14759_c0_g2_i1:282-617(+)